MDVAAKRQELINQQAAIEGFLQHPVTVEVIRDLDEQVEAAITQILQITPTDIESFLNREQSLGHLRGLRRAKSKLTESLEDVKEQLKELGE
jgi:hypothetical protein